MRCLACWICCAMLFPACRSETTPPEKTERPFSDVFVTADPAFAPGTNLCVVLDTPAARGDEYDHAVAQHSAAALQAAQQVTNGCSSVIFFLRKRPRATSGSVASFTLAQLQDITKLYESGKKFNSRQSWVSRTLPQKQ